MDIMQEKFYNKVVINLLMLLKLAISKNINITNEYVIERTAIAIQTLLP